MMIPEQMPEKDFSFVKFYKRAVRQNFLSEQEGRPIYKDVDYVEIITPGQDKAKVDRAVKDQDKNRWPRQWDAYLRNLEQRQEGTPLTQWPNLQPSEVAMLQSLSIFTIEALAELSDAGVQNIGPGGVELRRRAQYFLNEAVPKSAAANAQAMNDELRAENERLDFELKQAKNDLLSAREGVELENRELRAELAELRAQMQVPEKRKPGRPRTRPRPEGD